MTENKLVQRQYNLDYLRVFASVAIILLHVTAQNIHYVELAGTEWNIYNICNSASRWGVPVFVMMSGALFLPREIPTKTLYKKYISRMAIAYVVWSLFYAIIDPIGNLIFTEGYQISFVEIIGSFISGAVHLWFLPMIIGLYMCIPLIKQLTQNDKLIKYFLLLSIIFCFIKVEIELVTNNLLSGNIQIIFQNVNTVFKNFNMNLIVGFVAYFILGFYLNKTEISKKHRTIIYILGVAGLILTILLNLFASKNAGKSSEAFYNASTVNVLLMSVAVFVWFKYNVTGTEKLNKIIIHLSKYSFGAFLVHIFILQCLKALGIQSASFHPVLSVPAITIFTTVVSYLISLVLNKIPIIKKYIV
ncbi:MAG: acyltransferase family protein [Acutalibacteraceae bacterium]|nr:acyltransferase family protein [Acutalibacteraceae bacterium]